MPGGFKRYNEIQKAISTQLKRDGISLKEKGLKFHELSKNIYHQTKSTPLNYAVMNIDQLVGNITDPSERKPEIVSTLLEEFYFWKFDENWSERKEPAH